MSGWGISAPDPARFAAEIEAAAQADANERKFPPLLEVSCTIRQATYGVDSLAGIPATEWRMLADYLAGKHRGKKGKKTGEDSPEQYREIDIGRATKFLTYRESGMSRPEAIAQLLREERLSDSRSIERSVKRGESYLEQDIEAGKWRILELQLELKQREEEAQTANRLLLFTKLPDCM